jgi:endoglucanase
MKFLKVSDGKIVDSEESPVMLRGIGIGGWMNMENFINGFPGAEYTLKKVLEKKIGKEKSDSFFKQIADHFFTEKDAAFIKELGANVVRLPVNYRHFESDAEPFSYIEKGFERLEKAISFCAEHDLYVIIDLHSVQGWQNTDWHCDNPTRHGFFWEHPHFQDRFIALWEEMAKRFKDNPAVAGYDVMNEPLTTSAMSRYSGPEEPEWDRINNLYKRVVGAIRKIDEKHIIFLEGDVFSNLFSGLDTPFSENLVYSSHNYIPPGFGPGKYPGKIHDKNWDRGAILEDFLDKEGTDFAKKHNVPLWIGEFGSVYNGPPEEIEYRLKSLDDQISIFNELNIHWTIWTYKDIGVMGLLHLKPEYGYMYAIQDILEAKRLCGVDFWCSWLPATKPGEGIKYIARYVEQAINDPDISPLENEHYLSQAALAGYVGSLMQPAWANIFSEMSEEEISLVLESFSIEKCNKNEALIKILKKHLKRNNV